MTDYTFSASTLRHLHATAEELLVAKKLHPHPNPTEIFAPAKSAFVIRSASPEVFRHVVMDLRRMNPQLHLHILSHERDAALIADIAQENFTFHAYTAGGSYDFDKIPAAMVETLRAAAIDRFLLLSNNLTIDGYEHIIKIIHGIGGKDISLFNSLRCWYHLPQKQISFYTSANKLYRDILEATLGSLPTTAPTYHYSIFSKPTVFFDFSILNRSHMTGVERYTMEIGKELFARNKYHYSYIGGELPGKIFKDFPNAHHINIETPEGTTHAAQKELAYWASQQKADLYVSTMFPVPERKSFKTILTINDLIPLRMPEFYKTFSMYDYYDKYIRASVRHADAIMTISEYSKKDIVEIFDIDPAKIHIFTLAADKKFHPLKNDPLWPTLAERFKLTTRRYLLAVCTANPHKNLLRVLQAFELLKQKKDFSDLKLVLVGTAGAGANTLNEALVNHPFASDIVRTGHLEDAALPTLYRGCGAFVWPSLYEGFGLPPLEAMSCGTPVVTSTLTSLPEVVGDAAFNCDALSVESIASATLQALTNEPLRAQKIAAGFARAQKFSWLQGAKDMENLFASLL